MSFTPTALIRNLRYLGRPGILLSRTVDKAKRFQQAGDEIMMRRTLLDGAEVANCISKRRITFRLGWKGMVEFHLAIFNLSTAEAVARCARELGFPESEEVLENVKEITAQTAAWRDCIETACKSLNQKLEAGSAQDFLVFIPSTALGLDVPNEPNMRKGLRFIFGEIIATCREAGIPFDVRGRIANHGTPTVPEGHHYASHHTISSVPGGLHIKATDRPSCFSLDACGYSGWSQFARTPLKDLNTEKLDPAVTAKFFQIEKERIIGNNISKYGQANLAGSDVAVPEGYVFIGLQMPGDAVQRLARIPMLSMLEEVAWVCKARGIPVVVKRHPKCRSRIVSQALAKGVAGGMYQLSNASIHALIAGSCAVCVVNSSVGAEALLHEKPVYVFGESEYQHICYRMKVAGDFKKTFHPYKMPVSETELHGFLYLLRHEYAVDVTDTKNAADFIRRKVLAHAANRS